MLFFVVVPPMLAEIILWTSLRFCPGIKHPSVLIGFQSRADNRTSCLYMFSKFDLDSRVQIVTDIYALCCVRDQGRLNFEPSFLHTPHNVKQVLVTMHSLFSPSTPLRKESGAIALHCSLFKPVPIYNTLVFKVLKMNLNSS